MRRYLNGNYYTQMTFHPIQNQLNLPTFITHPSHKLGYYQTPNQGRAQRSET